MDAVAWFALAAILLSFERICYAWAWRFPASFRRFCTGRVGARLGGEPVRVLETLFYGFKGIQLAVFAGWIHRFGHDHGARASAALLPLVVGVLLIGLGQLFNLAVFHRLGRTGVFYGNRFGHRVTWCQRFPFSVLRHPQYTGTVLSIWGLFVATRFPEVDWFVLPALETVYYAIGSRLES
jgi:methylene-fatty-acyl-phospholipid synthase